MNKKLILMFLFSLLAHVTIAGMIAYTYPGRSETDSPTGDDEIIWGVMAIGTGEDGQEPGGGGGSIGARGEPGSGDGNSAGDSQKRGGGGTFAGNGEEKGLITGSASEGRKTETEKSEDRLSDLSPKAVTPIESACPYNIDTQCGQNREESFSENMTDLNITMDRGQVQSLDADSMPLVDTKWDETRMPLLGTKEHENSVVAAGFSLRHRLVKEFSGETPKNLQFNLHTQEKGEQLETSTSSAPLKAGGAEEGTMMRPSISLASKGGGGCSDPRHCGEGWGWGPGVYGGGGRGKGGGGFLGVIRSEIERHKYYPRFARRNSIEGTVLINFHIGMDGRPQEIVIAMSSGSKILDYSGIRTIKSIRKFSHLPEGMNGLDITVPIAYRLIEEDNY